MTQGQIEFYQQCDRMGEQEVRNILARGGWNQRRTAWAEAWLNTQKDTLENKRYRETLSMGRSAANAAWVSAIAAVLAVIVSVVALIRTL